MDLLFCRVCPASVDVYRFVFTIYYVEQGCAVRAVRILLSQAPTAHPWNVPHR